MTYWAPDNLAKNVQMWLNINDIPAVSGNEAGTVQPSGEFTGIDFAGNSSDRPELATLSGNAVLDFEEGDDYYVAQSLSGRLSSIGGGERYILIGHARAKPNGNAIVLTIKSDSSQPSDTQILTSKSFFSTTITAKANTGPSSQTLGTYTFLSGFHIIEAQFEQEAPPNDLDTHTYFLDGSSVATIEDEPATVFDNDESLALGDDNGSGFDTRNQFEGTIGDLVILNYVPSESERSRLQGWYAHKFGAEGQLPASHQYKEYRPLARFEKRKDGLDQLLEGGLSSRLTLTPTFGK
jgi:hypothetical protein